jgi:DNA-binding transcriptional ArsR family regulator
MNETNSCLRAANLLQILSHPARLRILDELRRGEACVCHLQAVLQRRQPCISQQLALLRAAGVAESRRDGTFIYYQLADPRIIEALDALLGPAGHPRHHPDCTCPECQGCQNTNLPCDTEGEAT